MEALTTAIEFFHDRLDDEIVDHGPNGTHPDRPETPRVYFEEVRGWNPSTVEEKRLGWAPADETSLARHLDDHGYSRDEILATGLVNRAMKSLWAGRYVFPYFVDGEPVYAISRTTGRKGGVDYDGHPNDRMAGKYAKPAHTKSWVDVDEPIFGIDTLDRDGPVLITEGIADAITAHEAGYVCISSVTTSFKNHHREALPDMISNSRRIVIINDAERPTIHERDSGGLSISQFGEGINGAISTGVPLEEAGLDVRLGELPRPGLRKVDLDDFIREWGSLDAVLRSAKPPSQHPAYVTKPEVLEEHQPKPISRDGDSVVWDLTLPDVLPVPLGYRGVNPLGHHGDSEDYFIFKRARSGYLAYDHKYKKGYNSLTYLLCEAGIREPARPNGSLSDHEKFLVWLHAKKEGYISSDDKVPHAALRGLAKHRDLVDDFDDGWRLPANAYNAVLGIIEEEFDLDSGREPVQSNYEVLAEVTSFHDWRDARHETTISTDEAHSRVQAAIEDAVRNCDDVLVDALPSTGKSHGAVAAAAATGVQATILVGRGREEMYEQYREWASQYDLTVYRLPALDDCPAASGEHGDDQQRMVMKPYSRGASVAEIHDRYGDVLTCQQNGGCPYLARWDFEPEDYDILLGHYVHAHLPNVVAGRAVIIDEFPDDAYETKLDANGLNSAIRSIIDDMNVSEFKARGRNDKHVKRQYLPEFMAPDGTPCVDKDVELAFTESGHANAPLAVATLLFGRDLGNDFEWADLGHIRGVYDQDQQSWHALTPPQYLRYARAVIGLDGTPTTIMWDLALCRHLDHRQVLDDEERLDYLKNTLSHEYVRTTQNIKPPGSEGQYVNVEQDMKLFEWVADNHVIEPGLVTSQRALRKYQNEPDFHIDDALYYGNLLGSNEFKDRTVGIVSCSHHFGDGFVKKWGAYLGEAVERVEEDGMSTRGVDLSYTGIGNEILLHMREHQTLQAVLRFGRGGQGARVYVHTNTLPDWVEIDHEATVSTFGAKQHEIVKAILEQTGEFSRRELDVSASTQWTTKFLGTLVDEGVLKREERRGRYYYTVADDLPDRGLVDVQIADENDAQEGGEHIAVLALD